MDNEGVNTEAEGEHEEKNNAAQLNISDHNAAKYLYHILTDLDQLLENKK